MLDNGCFGANGVDISALYAVPDLDFHCDAVFFLGIEGGNRTSLSDECAADLFKLFQRTFDTVKYIRDDTGTQNCGHWHSAARYGLAGLQSRC